MAISIHSPPSNPFCYFILDSLHLPNSWSSVIPPAVIVVNENTNVGQLFCNALLLYADISNLHSVVVSNLIKNGCW